MEKIQKGMMNTVNSSEIRMVCKQLRNTCEHICDLISDAELLENRNSDMLETWTNMELDGLEHVQVLVLKLTELMTEPQISLRTDDESGSAFMAGELNDCKDNRGG